MPTPVDSSQWVLLLFPRIMSNSIRHLVPITQSKWIWFIRARENRTVRCINKCVNNFKQNENKRSVNCFSTNSYTNFVTKNELTLIWLILIDTEIYDINSEENFRTDSQKIHTGGAYGEIKRGRFGWSVAQLAGWKTLIWVHSDHIIIFY